MDILVTPGVTVGVGCVLAMLVAPWIGAAASALGGLIMWATELQPFLMGIIVSVLVGMALTLSISSAAICAALSLNGLASGAALAGCCAQMVGFAAASYRENGVGGLLSQGIGTSMLQMGNIVKKPVVWVPAIVASAITGPIATCIFHMEQNGAAIASGDLLGRERGHAPRGHHPGRGPQNRLTRSATDKGGDSIASRYEGAGWD